MKASIAGGFKGRVRWGVRAVSEGGWMADFHAHGKRLRKRFGTKQAAEAWCRTEETRTGTQGARLARLPAETVARWQAVVKLAESVGLDAVEAMTAGVAALTARRASKLVSEAVAAFLGARAVPANDRRWRDFKGASARLGRLAASELGGRMLCDVSPVDFDAWLSALEVSPVTRSGFRRELGRLLNWSARQGWCAMDIDSRLETKRAAAGASHTVLTVGEMQRLLATASGELRAVVALIGLCGLRSSEALRLRWGKDVRLADGVIVVSPESSKVRLSRAVEISSGAQAWLASCARKKGAPVWAGIEGASSDARYRKALRDLGERAGVALAQNVLRHSALSYRRALLQDDGKVALWGGTSAAVVRSNYATAIDSEGALLREMQGRAWFETMPIEAENVVRFSVRA